MNGLKLIITLLLIILLIAPADTIFGAENKESTATYQGATYDIPMGVIDPLLVPIAYSGGETFRFDISYTGGFKLGELHISVKKDPEAIDSYIIDALVTTDNGMFSLLYPIEDRHVTRVSGEKRLPFHYEVWQKEGYSYEAHRITIYNQEDNKIHYYVNDNPVEIFAISDTTQNEFSSFFASRVMDHVVGKPFIVPTFADEKRIEVVVMVRERERLKKTILGDVDTVVVEPIMTFSGLYDKRGDTVIWYSDDECRVPVKVNSKILIGSLTAKLVAYTNPSCPQYHGALHKKLKPKKKSDNKNRDN